MRSAFFRSLPPLVRSVQQTAAAVVCRSHSAVRAFGSVRPSCVCEKLCRAKKKRNIENAGLTKNSTNVLDSSSTQKGPRNAAATSTRALSCGSAAIAVRRGVGAAPDRADDAATVLEEARSHEVDQVAPQPEL